MAHRELQQYLIVNLGLSRNFGDVDLEHLQFPTVMSIDYIRVYQPSNKINIGCDPEDFPTSAYINQYVARAILHIPYSHFPPHRYLEAYTNPNLTTWVDDFKQIWPKNQFLGQC
jgi:hypothetical protein